MMVAIHQPAYLPWLGYFHKILQADLFVLLDTVQMEKNGFVNRNRVWTPQGVQWLTVPVLMKGHTHSSLQEMRINPAASWKSKHLRTLALSYVKRPHYPRYAGDIERLLVASGEDLTPFLARMLAYFLEALGLKEKRVVLASTLAPEGKATTLLLDICKKAGATSYLSGVAGRDYLERKPFEEAGIEVVFQDFRHPRYDQGRPGFEPNLALVDALFNIGGEAVLELLKGAGGVEG
ncbi:MAG: WbqC family protein [Candidatus Omnitrophica bacterium]|uniref:WbqC family protein n=1 Tax=Tectimicrobiota bacterium TaxID=2528274 RepID=A0A932HVX6_UNCTE|nr:WbqC family protein [Candidatus Omnitrophota bacterium]MBI3126511.1 WbqC family protein [Candidatus Tectomicrobia bacterium]